MKKLTPCSIAILSITVLLTSSAFSQELAVNSRKKMFSNPETINAPGSIRYANDVNGKVLRSFRKYFGEKQDVLWSRTTENDFVACYKESGKTIYAYFKEDGMIQYTVSHYGEEELPKNVRHIVKSNFYDYSITHVSEVHKDDVAWFFITVTGQSSIKTIRVTGEEWQVVEEIVKQQN